VLIRKPVWVKSTTRLWRRWLILEG
jgi:hypothetical protein